MSEYTTLRNAIKRLDEKARTAEYMTDKVEAYEELRNILFDIMDIVPVDVEAECAEDPRR